ncbi:hypothetical protein [Solibacillus daqui]|uniref:hypothetical protein n=1 Tax=Solibacillus daqui TaxID=2912187 RepID=UPI002366D706|nr:hypothetical protein [Solibacillus daqui]
MNRPSFLYKLNIALEIILFSISLIILGILLEEGLYVWFTIISILALGLEILLKVKSVNPIINRAQKLESKSIELTTNGIENIYFMYNNDSKNDRNSQIIKAIDNATEMFLLAETGKSYLDKLTARHWNNVKNQLNNGTQFKVLLIDPTCENKVARNKRNNRDGVDKKLDIDDLIELDKTYENLTIKFTNHVYNTVFFTDTYMVYDPYHLGKTSDRLENNFVAIEFSSSNNNYKTLKSHFEYCWDNAKTLEEVADESQGENNEKTYTNL